MNRSGCPLSITYEQKRQILDYMSQPGHWGNHFDMNFFTDERRKWRTTTQNDVSVSASPDRRSFFLEDQKTGASLLLIVEKDNSRIITDESGSIVKVNAQSEISASKGAEVANLESAYEIGLNQPGSRIASIPELSCYARFYNNGGKAVFLDDRGTKISLPPPKDAKAATMHMGRFFHVVSFDLDTAASWGMTPYGLLNGAKLIVSKDLSIEPDLRTFNDLDPQRAAEYLDYLLRDDYDTTFKGPWQWRPKIDKKVGDIAHLQKKWTDVTEFSGYFIATPQQFHVETTDSGFNIGTSLDHRETIWAQAAVLKAASSGHIVPVETVSSRFAPRTLMHLLQNSQALPDHRGRSWNYVVIHAKETADIAKEARKIGRENFSLTGYHFAALNYDDQTCLVAMDTEVLEKLSRSYDATIEMLHMIKSRNTDAAKMKDLLEAGADLRFVNPEEVAKGRTFANEMAQAENFELLAELRDNGGVHDLSPIEEEPPEPQGPIM